jgi:hypothetical protein
LAADVLSELSRREKQLGVKPDSDIDAFMKVSTLKQNGAVLNLVLFSFGEW